MQRVAAGAFDGVGVEVLFSLSDAPAQNPGGEEGGGAYVSSADEIQRAVSHAVEERVSVDVLWDVELELHEGEGGVAAAAVAADGPVAVDGAEAVVGAVGGLLDDGVDVELHCREEVASGHGGCGLAA